MEKVAVAFFFSCGCHKIITWLLSIISASIHWLSQSRCNRYAGLLASIAASPWAKHPLFCIRVVSWELGSHFLTVHLVTVAASSSNRYHQEQSHLASLCALSSHFWHTGGVDLKFPPNPEVAECRGLLLLSRSVTPQPCAFCISALLLRKHGGESLVILQSAFLLLTGAMGVVFFTPWDVRGTYQGACLPPQPLL